MCIVTLQLFVCSEAPLLLQSLGIVFCKQLQIDIYIYRALEINMISYLLHVIRENAAIQKIFSNFRVS